MSIADYMPMTTPPDDSQTPMTDAKLAENPYVINYVPADFARSLETSLAAEREQSRRRVKELTAKQPINTHVRLFDLVRQMRSELHQADLITNEEYAWLSGGAPLATCKEGGSPSPRRLEDYDQLRSDLASLREDGRRLEQVAWKELTLERTDESWVSEHGCWSVFRKGKFVAGGNTYQWAIDAAVKAIDAARQSGAGEGK